MYSYSEGDVGFRQFGAPCMTRGPFHKDYSICRFILGSPYSWKLSYMLGLHGDG